ncbi:glycosyltransferase family 8 protein [Neobacillus mesonae]|uniref:glycosyltransferase family 8 protein n=1 Tax=Neobacillus mesonae TaxID=1193713 RepID=UPI0008352F90|nr:glycosyltransferase family 8 protein [Neobacillus mesonae]
MYIVTATNDSYAKHLGVMLHSLLENLIDKTNTNIFIIEANISRINKMKLQRIVERHNLQVEFITINDNDYSLFRKVGRFTKEAYYRILIPELLGRDITKAIYLDCDLIVRKDISRLWTINIDDYFLAAAEVLEAKKMKKPLSIPANSIYFNSGVLLINLQKWRENNISTQVIQYIKDNPAKVKLPDQDGLNAILYDKCLKLDHEWNYTTRTQKRIRIYNPAIVHFTGRKKPWNSDVPFKIEYLKYLNSSLWEQQI